MEYLNYLKEPHYLALLCGVVSVIIAFAESKYSKEKHKSKYYLKIFLLVVINVYAVLMLVKKGIIPIQQSLTQKGGGEKISSGVLSSGVKTGTNIEPSSINTSNYETVDIGNPNF